MTLVKLGSLAKLLIDKFVVNAGGTLNLEQGPLLIDRNDNAKNESLKVRLAETHGKAGIDFSLDEITHENFSGWLQGSSRFILAFGQSLAPDRYDFARGDVVC